MSLSGHERLEDVFQDEVTVAFIRISDFKKFARSIHGLKLDEAEVETIVHDNRDSVEEQKIQMLHLWKTKQGSDATAGNIRNIVEQYWDQIDGKSHGKVSRLEEIPEQPSSEKANDALKIYRLQEQCTGLMRSTKYLQALERLELLNLAQPDQLQTILMTAECNIFLGRQEGMEAIDQAVALLTASQSKEVFDEFQHCVKNGQYVRALIFLVCVTKLCTSNICDHKNVTTIGECLDKVHCFCRQLRQRENSLRSLVNRLIISLMHEALEKVENCANVSADTRVRMSVRCLENIADAYLDLDNQTEALKLYHQCVDMMERQYGKHAVKLRYYSESVRNTAVAFYDLGDCAAAKRLLRWSIRLLREAQDCDETHREHWIGVMEEAVNDIDEGFDPRRNFEFGVGARGPGFPQVEVEGNISFQVKLLKWLTETVSSLQW